MAVEQQVPPDLASLPPGPQLAAELEHLTLDQVPDEQIVDVLRATGRQLAHLQALSWAAMVEIGHRHPDETPATAAQQAWAAMDSWLWTSSQIGAALTLSGRRADTEYGLATQPAQQLPQVWAALWTGQIDPAKAKVFAGYLANLTATQIELICRRLLPGAPRWTCGQLAHRLLREGLAIDPAFTRRRYQKGARERGVWGYLAEDGTAVVSAHGLSPVEAAAAAERLAELADAVRAAGHPATVSQLRADLFVRLLDGRYAGYTSEEIITAMLADPTTTDPTPADPTTADQAPADQAPADPAPADQAPADPITGDPAAADRGAADSSAADPAPGQPAVGNPVTDPWRAADSDPNDDAVPVPLDPDQRTMSRRWMARSRPAVPIPQPSPSPSVPDSSVAARSVAAQLVMGRSVMAR